jgi:iodotyrosine deiodinase
LASKSPCKFLPLEWALLTPATQARRAREFEQRMATCRTVRHFSSRPVPFELIEAAIRIASRAPSGAHQQPWHFVVVGDCRIKHEIRLATEAEEKESYEHRMPDDWLSVLAPLGNDWHKEFIETAAWLIVVFRQDCGILRAEDGTVRKIKHYYVQESVGIASGFLIAALHWIGLATLTDTPGPMAFLSPIPERPPNEKPCLLIPVGFPAEDARVPAIAKKSLDQILTELQGAKERVRRKCRISRAEPAPGPTPKARSPAPESRCAPASPAPLANEYPSGTDRHIAIAASHVH